jgi:hypothetical protein
MVRGRVRGLDGRQPARVLALLLAFGLVSPVAAHGSHGVAGVHERLTPDERARLRDELRVRALEARRDPIMERGLAGPPGPVQAPEGWHRLSPEERRELRALLREERRRRHRALGAAQPTLEVHPAPAGATSGP